MPAIMNAPPVFRFAPSPNGRLHLGHALSALVNFDCARTDGGRFLLRIEDIDHARCKPEFVRGIDEDLGWLGLTWEEPVRRQSEHFDDYRAALDALIDAGLVYPSALTRSAIRDAVQGIEEGGRPWPRDPDGAPLYPGDERTLPEHERQALIDSGVPYAWRLDVDRAMAHAGGSITWQEEGEGPCGETGRVEADPRRWGDVVLARKDVPVGYHMAVTVDDALQGVTHVVRGRDLFHATSVHRLLQEILGFNPPIYRHHRLIIGEDGSKLSKSRGDTALAELRKSGLKPSDIKRMVAIESRHRPDVKDEGQNA